MRCFPQCLLICFALLSVLLVLYLRGVLARHPEPSTAESPSRAAFSSRPAAGLPIGVVVALTHAQAEFLSALDAKIEHSQAVIAKAREEADAAVVEPIENAWRAIERAADRMIAKSSEPLSEAQAMDRVLKTAEGKRLYGRYRAAQDLVAVAHESTEAEWGRRGVAEWIATRRATESARPTIRSRSSKPSLPTPKVAEAFGLMRAPNPRSKLARPGSQRGTK